MHCGLSPDITLVHQAIHIFLECLQDSVGSVGSKPFVRCLSNIQVTAAAVNVGRASDAALEHMPYMSPSPHTDL